MKKFGILCATALATLSLAACGNSSTKSSKSKTASSEKVVKHHHKSGKKTHKKASKKQSSSSSIAASSSNNAQNQQPNQQANNRQQANQGQNTQQSNNGNGGVNSADAAVAAAKAKYGDQNGYIHWGYMIDGTTGQPIKNPDGSYFVKGTANDGTMTGTQYSLNVHPDGSITSN